MIVVFFAVDMLSPFKTNIWFLYIFPILLTLLSNRKNITYVVASLITFFIIVELSWDFGHGGLNANQIIDHVYAVSGFWIMSVILERFKRLIGLRALNEQIMKDYMGMQGEIRERKSAEVKLQYVSFHDKLTDLYNRAYFEEELKRLMTSRELPVSVIMGDVNNLKLTNDVFGHEMGDKLLVRVAETMRGSCRDEDVIARWGGDEFIILLPKTSFETAGLIADKIKSTCFQDDGNEIPCHISLGVATQEKSEQPVSRIIKLAEERMYKNKMTESDKNRQEVIDSMIEKISALNAETRDHIKRLQTMAGRVGKALGLSEGQLDDLTLLGALHDIGKAGIPEEILSKTSKLTEEEWETVKSHTELGYRIARVFPKLAHIAEPILLHHERWDGTGYPRGLKGDEIPLVVRILSIIDSYDVMLYGRKYEKSFKQEDALKELERNAGTQFDPELVRIFVNTISSKLMKDR